MRVRYKNEKGITVIALTVTILVILILSGIVIGMITDQNGIFSNADESVRGVQEAKLIDDLKTAERIYKINNDEKDLTTQELREELKYLEFIDDEFIDFIIQDERTGALVDKENGIVINVIIDEDYNMQIEGIYEGDIENLEFLSASVTKELDTNTGRQYFVTVTTTSTQGIDNIILRFENGNIVEQRNQSSSANEKITTTFNISTRGDYEIVIEGTLDNNTKVIPLQIDLAIQPNAPALSDGMIPIKWNGTDWVICSESDLGWYNYEKQSTTTENGGTSKWANVMLEDGRYKEGQAVGTVVAESDLGSMFVWIPRYGYSIVEGYHSPIAGVIEVEFLEGKTSNTISGNNIIWDNASGEGNWNVHPAFTFGTNELDGFWVAKFEVSGSGTIEIVPNTVSTHTISINNIFTNSISMNNSGNVYGLNTNDNIVDPHMMKNMEWGAVTYLTHSAYGRNATEVTPNNDTSVRTGAGDYELNVKQSTTGNVTGIYDLSAGRDEYLAAYIENAVTTTNYTNLINADTRYKDVYEAGAEGTRESAYEANKHIYGDATYETSFNPDVETQNSWYNDYDAYPYRTGLSVFRRGGNWRYTGSAGIFYYSSHSGVGHESFGYRPTIAVIN